PAATQPTFVAWGEIDRAAPAESAFSIVLDGLVLLGARVVLEGVAGYRPSSAETFVVVARVAVAIGTTTYAFSGTLTIGEEAAALAGGSTSEAIAEPFGMTGVTLQEPQLEFAATYPPDDVTTLALRIAGRVTLQIGGAMQTCDGIVHFLDAVPVVAEVPVPVAMGIRDLFADLLPAGVWPEGYAPFDLAQPRLSFADVPSGSVSVDGRTYPAGYHALAGARFLGTPFTVDVAIGPHGIAMSGGAGAPIELVYLVLSEASVHVDTNNPDAIVYALDAGAQVFHAAFDPATLTWRRDAGWEGELVYDGEVVGIERPAVAFGPDGPDGLRLLDWHVKPVLGDEELGWDTALEAASREGRCGQLSDLPLDKPITTSFDLHIRQTGPIVGDALPLALGGANGLPGTFTVSIDGSEIGPLPMADALGTIPAASAFQLADLRAWVVRALQESRQAIGASVLAATIDGEPALKRLLEPCSLDGVTQEQLERLLCRKVNSDNVVRHTNDAVSSGTGTSNGRLDDASRSAGISRSSPSIDGAASSATAAASALGLGAGVISELTSLVGLATGLGVLTSAVAAGWDDVTRRVPAVTGKVEEAKRRVTELLTMRGAPACSFLTPTSIQITWAEENLPAVEGIEYNGYSGFRYGVELSAELQFDRVIAGGETPDRTITISATPLEQCNTIYARLRACYERCAGGWIVGTGFHKIPLPSPAAVTEAYAPAPDAIDVTVTTVPGATAYTLQLVDHARVGALVATQSVPAPVPAPATVQGSFPAADLPSTLPAGALLLARACATGDPVTRTDSPFVDAPLEQELQIVDAPTGLQAIFRLPENDVRATWSAVADAAAYIVEVTGADGRPLEPPPTIVYDASPGATISGPAIAVGGAYELRVRALHTGRVSIRSAWVAVQAQSVPAPANPRLTYATAVLTANWDVVPGATRYLLDLDGMASYPDVAAPPISFAASATLPLRFGRTDVVTIRALVGSSLGPPASAMTTVPTSVAAMTNDWNAAVAFEQAAQELHTLAPGMGPTEIWDTLLAGGYAPAEATAGVRAVLPATTTQQLARIVEAIKERVVMIGLLHVASVVGADIVPLCRAIYSPAPLPLTVLLKVAGVPPTGLAPALATAFAISLTAAEAIVREVYG
ncbi:MAG: hypothetical protein WBC33_06940, partial [Conexibacter sp.]